MTDISVIIPIYNEEENIEPLYTRLKKTFEGIKKNYELIFINDGSKDQSINIIKRLASKDERIKYIEFSRNFGHQVAVSAGLDKAFGKAVVVIDADLQDPPELIEPMYKKMEEGFKVVYAKRKTRKGEKWMKLGAIKVFYRLLAKITSIDIPLDTGDFRIMDQQIVEILRQMPEKNKFVRGQIAWIGFSQTFVEYHRDERAGGRSGYTIKKLFQLAIDGITGFSDLPLRIVTYFGFIVSVFAFVVTIYALYSRFFKDSIIEGWTSLMISILFIGGVQMIAIGIMGEYLSRMNNNVRNRPLYIVKDSNME